MTTARSVTTGDSDIIADDVLASPYALWQSLPDAAAAVRLTRYDTWVLARHADVRTALGEPET